MKRLDAARLAFDQYMQAMGETDLDPQQVGEYISELIVGALALADSEGYVPGHVAVRALRQYSDSRGAAHA